MKASGDTGYSKIKT